MQFHRKVSFSSGFFTKCDLWSIFNVCFKVLWNHVGLVKPWLQAPLFPAPGRPPDITTNVSCQLPCTRPESHPALIRILRYRFPDDEEPNVEVDVSFATVEPSWERRNKTISGDGLGAPLVPICAFKYQQRRRRGRKRSDHGSSPALAFSDRSEGSHQLVDESIFSVISWKFTQWCNVPLFPQWGEGNNGRVGGGSITLFSPSEGGQLLTVA